MSFSMPIFSCTCTTFPHHVASKFLNLNLILPARTTASQTHPLPYLKRRMIQPSLSSEAWGRKFLKVPRTRQMGVSLLSRPKQQLRGKVGVYLVHVWVFFFLCSLCVCLFLSLCLCLSPSLSLPPSMEMIGRGRTCCN